MGSGIRHFMWGYQRHFCIGQGLHAERLFQALDVHFTPEVFVVGILSVGDDDRFAACVEPEDDFWIPSEAFDAVWPGVPARISAYPESQLRHSHPLAQKWQDEGLVKRAVQDAVGEVANSYSGKPVGVRYFVSWPVPVDGYLVCLVLGLQDAVIRSHASLSTCQVPIHEYRSNHVPPSLIEAAVDEYLRDATSQLLTPDPGSDPSLSGRSTDELLRAAGRRLLAGVAGRVDTFDNQEGHEALLFDACGRLSAMKYEGADSAGRILLARADHAAVLDRIIFDDPLRTDNSRAMRKLLELAHGDMALHMNAKHCFALSVLRDYDPTREDVFEVSIMGHQHWSLSHAGIQLMHVKDGLPALPAPVANPEIIKLELHREFRQCAEYAPDLLVDLVCEAAGEKHGTMLVISQNASAEAERLRQQAIPIEPQRLSIDLLRQLTPIDGAVLLDPSGRCYSIGLILDGLATGEGNLARGARYNSAVRYVSSQECSCIVVVISEDGGLDILLNRRPPIYRYSVDERLSQLDAMLAEGYVNRRIYRQIMDWFDKNRFYVTHDDCSRLNGLVAALDKAVAQQDSEAPRIVRREFSVDPAFSPELYYMEELRQ